MRLIYLYLKSRKLIVALILISVLTLLGNQIQGTFMNLFTKDQVSPAIPVEIFISMAVAVIVAGSFYIDNTSIESTSYRRISIMNLSQAALLYAFSVLVFVLLTLLISGHKEEYMFLYIRNLTSFIAVGLITSALIGGKLGWIAIFAYFFISGMAGLSINEGIVKWQKWVLFAQDANFDTLWIPIIIFVVGLVLISVLGVKEKIFKD